MRRIGLSLCLAGFLLCTLAACSSGPMTAAQKAEADEWIDGPGSD